MFSKCDVASRTEFWYSQVSAVQILRDAVSKKSRQAALNSEFSSFCAKMFIVDCHLELSVKKWLRGARKSEALDLRAVQTAGALPTFASFAVTIVTNLASTANKIHEYSDTMAFDITDGRRSSALVNVWANNNKNDKHNTSNIVQHAVDDKKYEIVNDTIA